MLFPPRIPHEARRARTVCQLLAMVGILLMLVFASLGALPERAGAQTAQAQSGFQA